MSFGHQPIRHPELPFNIVIFSILPIRIIPFNHMSGWVPYANVRWLREFSLGAVS